MLHCNFFTLRLSDWWFSQFRVCGAVYFCWLSIHNIWPSWSQSRGGGIALHCIAYRVDWCSWCWLRLDGKSSVSSCYCALSRMEVRWQPLQSLLSALVPVPAPVPVPVSAARTRVERKRTTRAPGSIYYITSLTWYRHHKFSCSTSWNIYSRIMEYKNEFNCFHAYIHVDI